MIMNNHTPYQRIGTYKTSPQRCQFQRTLHKKFILVVIVLLHAYFYKPV